MTKVFIGIAIGFVLTLLVQKFGRRVVRRVGTWLASR
jgi:hypothetical protein